MPHQDAQGTWISDDGLQYWDGTAWRPIGMQAAPRRGMSPVPAILIGCGFIVVLVLVLVIGFTVLVFNNADMQRAFCNGYSSGNANLECPFHPTP